MYEERQTFFPVCDLSVVLVCVVLVWVGRDDPSNEGEEYDRQADGAHSGDSDRRYSVPDSGGVVWFVQVLDTEKRRNEDVDL